MRYTRHVRLPFDPQCDFVYLRTQRVSGQLVDGGAPVTKADFTPRRLKQMYDARHIGYAAGQKPSEKPRRRSAVGPEGPQMAAGGEAEPPKVKRGIPRLRRFAA